MMKPPGLDDEQQYQAAISKDARFDGVFFIAVSSTGIYCRPSCPAITPKREHMRYYRTAAAAQEAGYRACKRCRPDASPGSPEWNIRADVVGRAMRLNSRRRLMVPGIKHDGSLGLGRCIIEKRRHERIVAILFDFEMERGVRTAGGRAALGMTPAHHSGVEALL